MSEHFNLLNRKAVKAIMAFVDNYLLYFGLVLKLKWGIKKKVGRQVMFMTQSMKLSVKVIQDIELMF